MNQSLHIFRKDVRHLWPELTTYLVLLITFAWAAPQAWDGNGRFNSLLQILLVLLHAVIFILWMVVVARLLQDESLVGDQQFWITRPYTRVSLLGAKLLFLAVCVALPFVLMQIYLLAHGGVNPLSAMPALLLNLGSLAMLCWLPFAAIAAVTSTLPRMVMSLLGAAIGWIIVLVIMGRSIGLRMNPPYALPIFAALWTVLVAGALLYQYMTRRTKHARVTLLATPVLLLVLFAIYPTGWLIPIRYSAPKKDAVHMTFTPDSQRQERQDGEEANFDGQRIISLPVHLEEADPKTRLDNVGVQVTADVPGYHYQSHWLPGGLSSTLLLPVDVVHRLEAAPTHLHMVIVGDQLTAGAPEQAIVAARFNVTGHGSCLLPEDGIGGPFCHYAYRNEAPTEVKGTVTLPPCGANSPTLDDSTEIPSFPKPFLFDPVDEESLQMRHGVLCPGTQLTFTQYHPAGHVHAELAIPSISIGAYVRHNDFRGRPLGGNAPSAQPANPPASGEAAPPAKAAPAPSQAPNAAR